MEKKYELTDATATIGKTTLYRIKALKSFSDVTEGDLGGYIETETNLSHEGDCWVYSEAKIHDHALVSDNARVEGNAQLHDYSHAHGNAIIAGDVHLHDNSEVYDNGEVRGLTRLYDNVQVYENGRVFGTSKIYGDIQVYGKAVLSDVNINYDNHRCDYEEHCECRQEEQP